MIHVETIPEDAADLLERALLAGLDLESDPPRAAADIPAGQLLMMPSAVPGYAGVKIVGVGGTPRIQGVYLLLDGTTLTPLAWLDGTELTAVRTPAVSALAARHLAAPDARRLVVFGTGPQAEGHVAALRAERPIDHVTVVGRGGAAEFAERCGGEVGTPASVAGADIVACCTTAREPLFDGRLVADGALVIAVGSHEPDAREVDAGLVARSDVYVEARSAARREAGDLIMAGDVPIAGDLAELVRGPEPAERPRLFKSVGMAWEDLVVAVAAYERVGSLGNR